MTVQQAILERRSIRNFTPEPLNKAQLDTLAAAALATPSGMDRQPWQFHFVLSPAIIQQISDATLNAFQTQGNQAMVERITSRHSSLFYGAPLVVIISLPLGSPQALDAGIAAQTLVLAAQGLGLGSCIIGLAGAGFSGTLGQNCREAVGMTSDREFAISVAIGHPAMTKDAHETHPEKIIWVN